MRSRIPASVRRIASRCGALLALAPPAAWAQGAAPIDSVHHEGNAWLVYAGSHRWSSRFGLHLEAQLRRAEGGAAPKQLLLRPGVQYHWTPRVTLTAGYAYVRTSPHGTLAEPIAFPEHRAWEQVAVRTPAGRLAVEHRLRVEHRWVATVARPAGAPPRRAGWGFSNRARYQLRATRPLHGGAPADPGWYATATAEPFVRFGGSARGRAFDQNRAFVGLGRRWGERLRVEGGYLNQYDAPARGRAREVSHALQLAFYSDARL